MDNLTDWISGDKKPVRAGVYQRLLPVGGSTAYWHFNGKYWNYGGTHSPHLLGCYQDEASNEQSLPWRGLASDPKAKP